MPAFLLAGCLKIRQTGDPTATGSSAGCWGLHRGATNHFPPLASHLAILQPDCWKGAGFMPLTRGEAVGYDAHLMTFEFTMKSGVQIVQCQISRAALGNLAGGWRNSARDLPTEFEAHRELIETIASEQFDQTSNKETKPVSIFATDVKMPERRHFYRLVGSLNCSRSFAAGYGHSAAVAACLL
jgi:hypothetical protein